MVQTNPEPECCPEFHPEPWQDREITWQDKRFVRDRVRSFFYVPLNFAGVMKRTMARIEAAGATTKDRIVLTANDSPWGADVYVEAAKDVPGAQMATVAGTFLSKVFEGPYRNMGKWMKEMWAFVAARGKTAGKLYTYYTTCPKCAKKYGKNYVVLLAQI